MRGGARTAVRLEPFEKASLPGPLVNHDDHRPLDEASTRTEDVEHDAPLQPIALARSRLLVPKAARVERGTIVQQEMGADAYSGHRGSSAAGSNFAHGP